MRPASPSRPDDRGDPYMSLATRGAWMCLAAHAIFLVMFAVLGLWLLCMVNVASVVLYSYIVASVRRRYYRPLNLVSVELFLHAVAAGWAIGWDSGFHYYLLLFLPVALQSGRDTARRIGWALAAALGYLGLSFWQQGLTPHYQVPGQLVTGLRLVNIATFLAILGYLCLLYAQIVARAETRLRVLAERDVLTGLYNRASMMRLVQEVAAGTSGHGTWLVFVDIDHFKGINDRYGHARGDDAIRAVADTIRRVVREGDHAGRWGGEEFLVLLPDADRGTALSVAERIRAFVAAQVAADEHDGVRVSVTCGVAERILDESFDHALNRADAALYLGKANGRNRVEIAS